MKVAIAQLNYTVGALKSNKFKIIENIYKARQAGAELVVFSEHSISGANCMYILTKAQFLESCEVTLVEIASHCEDIAVIVGLPIMDGSKKVSAGVLIQNRRIVKYIGKKTINSYDEKHYFDSSTGCEFLTVGETKIAVALGDDILTEERFGDNTDLIVCIHASSYYRRHIEVRYEYLRMISFLKNKTVLFVNHVGGQAETVYDGSSCVFRSGEGIAFLKSFEEDFKVVDTRNDSPVPIPVQNHTANVYSAMKLGLHDFFEKNGFTKACLGLSGGIDSAVVLAIAVDVLGSDNVRVMMLPSEFSSDHSLSDAIEMAENLGVAYDVIPINEAYHTILDSLKPVIGGTSFDNTEENLQARIRCDMLMAMSNKFQYILLNTSNKSELLMGYGTLYGDLSGAISIMGGRLQNRSLRTGPIYQPQNSYYSRKHHSERALCGIKARPEGYGFAPTLRASRRNPLPPCGRKSKHLRYCGSRLRRRIGRRDRRKDKSQRIQTQAILPNTAPFDQTLRGGI